MSPEQSRKFAAEALARAEYRVRITAAGVTERAKDASDFASSNVIRDLGTAIPHRDALREIVAALGAK